jgi:hypothetical protein
MPAQTPPVATGAAGRADDRRGGAHARPPDPHGAHADQGADAAADQHDGTDTWGQATDAAGTVRATRDMPEPDSPGG